MERLTAEEKKTNIEAYRKTIHPPREGEPFVPVRVMSNPGFWYCPTPNTGKLYTEGEELMVPEHVWLNSDYHSERKSVSGLLIRGILERTDQHKPKLANQVSQDDLKALVAQNQELQRQLAAALGRAPAEPLVIVPKEEEI
jgi:hypothetical protein